MVTNTLPKFYAGAAVIVKVVVFVIAALFILATSVPGMCCM